MLEVDGVRLPRVGTEQEYDLGILDLAVGTGAATHPKDCRQTGDARCVSSTVAALDVVAADNHPGVLLSHIVELIRGFRATQHSENGRVSPGKRSTKTFGNIVQCFVLTHLAELAVAANEWFGQSGLVLHPHASRPLNSWKYTTQNGVEALASGGCRVDNSGDAEQKTVFGRRLCACGFAGSRRQPEKAEHRSHHGR